MSTVRRSLAVLLAVLMIAPAAQAQTHVIGKSELAKAVQQRVNREQADREAIAALLQRDEVRQIASRAGLSIEKAEAALSTLDGNELRDIAAQARQVQDEMAGGATTVVLTATTIIIILLIVIIIILIAD